MNQESLTIPVLEFQKNRILRYLRYALRIHHYLKLTPLIPLTSIGIIIGMATDDIILKWFIALLFFSFEIRGDHNEMMHHFLLPISDRFIANVEIAIQFVENYACFIFIYAALNFGTWLMQGSEMPIRDFTYRFTPENLSYSHFSFIAFGTILCWISAGLMSDKATSGMKSPVLIFMYIAILGVYLMRVSHAWIALIIVIPVLWVLTKFPEAWREREVNKKTLWMMPLAGIVLLTLALVLPPFNHDLIGWNLVVACETIFLMISPAVIAPMNLRRTRQA